MATLKLPQDKSILSAIKLRTLEISDDKRSTDPIYMLDAQLERGPPRAEISTVIAKEAWHFKQISQPLHSKKFHEMGINNTYHFFMSPSRIAAKKKYQARKVAQCTPPCCKRTSHFRAFDVSNEKKNKKS